MIEDDREVPTWSDSDVSAETTPVGQPDAEGAAEAVESSRFFFLTNRMNLNGVLSSRLIAPRESFDKYYMDLLDLCPGWVPILIGTPSASLQQRVVTERGSGGPVLLELSDDVIDGTMAEGPVAYLAAIPFSKVSAIHFPDEKALREHRARGYKNVQPHEELLKVSPKLFSMDAEVDVQIFPPEDAPTIDWTRIDRIRGAVNGLLAASDSGEALAVAATALRAPPGTGDMAVPPWLNWEELAGRPMTAETEDAPSEADRLIFETAYRVLGRHDKAESWSPRDVLDQVVGEIASLRPSDEAEIIVDRSIQRVRELLNVEREFEPFRNPDSPYLAAKALTMVLLRPDLEQLLEWPAAETGADETTRSVAALLAGRLRGLSREAVKLRNVVLDDLTAEWAVSAVKGSPSPIGSPSFVAGEAKTHLLINGMRVRESAPLLPDPVLVYKAMNARGRPAARVTISRSLGWPVVVRISVPSGSEVRTDDSMITITSVAAVKVETSVEEEAFLERLATVRGEARRQVDSLLRKPK